MLCEGVVLQKIINVFKIEREKLLQIETGLGCVAGVSTGVTMQNKIGLRFSAQPWTKTERMEVFLRLRGDVEGCLNGGSALPGALEP